MSDSENSGNGVEQSSCYSNGSATDVGTAPAAANVTVTKRASANMDYHGSGQNRHRNEKRQAMAASGNSHQAYPLVPKFLAPHGGAPFNERPYPNERMMSHNRHHYRNSGSNWSRRHGNHNNTGGFSNHINGSNLLPSSTGGAMHPNYQHHNISAPNSMLNLASGGPGNGGGVNGVANKKRGHNQMRTYQNSSGGFSNNVNNSNLNNSANILSRNAASPLNISSKSHQQMQQQQQAHAMLMSSTGSNVATSLPPAMLTQQLANVVRHQNHLVMQSNIFNVANHHQSISTPPLPSPQITQIMSAASDNSTYTRKLNKNGSFVSSKSREVIPEVGPNHLNMQQYYETCSVNSTASKSTGNIQGDAGLCAVNDGDELETVAGNTGNCSIDANNCSSANVELRIMSNPTNQKSVSNFVAPRIGAATFEQAGPAYDANSQGELEEQQRANSRLNQAETSVIAASFTHIMNAVPNPSLNSAPTNIASAQTGHSPNLHNVAIPSTDSSFDEFDKSVQEKPRSKSCINQLTPDRVTPLSSESENLNPSVQDISSSSYAQSSSRNSSFHIIEEGKGKSDTHPSAPNSSLRS